MVEVIVRVRPLSLLESANPQIKHVVTCLNGSIIVDAGRDGRMEGFMMGKHAPSRARQFHADNVLHPDCTQIELYLCRCREVVMSAFQGINGAILAYGATGSGKTHSMFGGEMSAAGIVYQAMQDIFEEKQRLEAMEGKYVQIACTFLEVYNEDVYDLLSPFGKQKLQVLDVGQAGDDANNKVRRANPESLSVKGLARVNINSIDDFAIEIEKGHRNRSTAATHANAVSSRSHAIITVEVEVRSSADATAGTFARIRLCDLAGSERAASTSNSGKRLQEGGNINKSLLALGSVVQALAKNKLDSRKDNFIPYRGSKLTRLLKDCLGGNCRTLMLFCVSPSSTACEETINTMLFAMQAKEIQVAAQRNEFVVNVEEVAREQEMLVEKLRHELAQAKDEILRLKGGGGGGGSVSGDISPVSCMSSTAAPSAPPPRVTTERSPLQQSLDAIVRKKEELRRAQKDAEETCTDIDIRIREHAGKIANYIGTSTLFGGGDASLQAPPVGIAGSYQELSRLRGLLEHKKLRAAELQTEHDEIDLAATKIINEIRRERQNPLLELQLENARLQKTIVEAECLAAFYHQQCTSLANKESNEWRPAVAQCVAALKELAACAEVPPEAKLRAHLAIAKTTIPFSPTEEILDAHQRYILSALEGRPMTTSRLHRAMDITFAQNPFSSTEQEKGPRHGTAVAGGTKHRPPLVPGGGSPQPNGGLVGFGRSLSSSPLTSPASLQLQIKKLTLHVNPASMMSPPGASSGAAAAKARVAALSGAPSGSPSPMPQATGGIQRFKSPVSALGEGSTPTGKQLLPAPQQTLVRLNTAQPVLTGSKKSTPPPKTEKENAINKM